MGKGDRRTKRGKVAAGTYGNSRPKTRKLNKKKATTKKTSSKKK